MSTAHHHLKTISLALGIAFAAPSAFAQSFDAVRLYSAAPGKDGGRFGGAVVATYQYQGSDERNALVIPLLDYQWANGWFAGITNGLGYNFSNSAQMQFGVRLTVDKGRKESRAAALRGMGTIDPAAEGGAFFNYFTPQGIFLTSSIRYGSGPKHKGLLVDLGAGYLTEIAPKWHLVAGTAITLANADNMQDFFGVTNAQATATSYAAYSAGAGARDIRANLALSYSLTQSTSITAALSASHLLGDAKDSPLTRKQTSGLAVFGITCAF
jgi:outer membrane scaffolding protein for murein synthesis (MipA/OmpV family)